MGAGEEGEGSLTGANWTRYDSNTLLLRDTQLACDHAQECEMGTSKPYLHIGLDRSSYKNTGWRLQGRGNRTEVIPL